MTTKECDTKCGEEGTHEVEGKFYCKGCLTEVYILNKNAPASPRPGDMYVDEEYNIRFYTGNNEWAKFNSGLEDQIVSKVMDYIFAKYHTQEDPSPIEKELHELLQEYQPFQTRLRAQEMLTRNEK